jgi:hypothetical protein
MNTVMNRLCKIGFVIKDIDEIMRTYTDAYNIGPWQVFEISKNSVIDMKVNNERKDYAAKTARSSIGEIIWELIQPLDDNSIYAKFLREHGEGIHHLGYEVRNIKRALKYFKKRNVNVLQSGNWAGNKFMFFDTGNDLKHIVEVYTGFSGSRYPHPVTTFSGTGKRKLDKPFFKRVTQVGIAVKNLNSLVKVYYDKYGIGPWVMLKYYSPKVENMLYRGRQLKDQRFTVAAAMTDNMQFEFMEPESGENIYSDWIDRYGAGLQHIQFEYNYSYREVMKYYAKRNCTILQQGTVNGLTYAYVGTDSDLKFISEPLDIPDDFVFPACEDSYPQGLHINDVL